MISRRKPLRVRPAIKNRRQSSNPISFPDLKAQVHITSNIHYLLKEELEQSPAYEAFVSSSQQPQESKVIPLHGGIVQPRR